MIQTAVLVSGGGTNLQAILDAGYFGELPGNLALTAVISSQPEAYALQRAEMAGVPTYVIDESLFPNNQFFCNALLGNLRNLDIELVVLAGFTPSLAPNLPRHYKNRILNTCPFLLPAPWDLRQNGEGIQAELLAAGAKIAGATAYFATEEPDRGLIICQRAIEIREDDTPRSLQRRVLEEGERPLLLQALSLYCDGRLSVEGGIVHVRPEAPEGEGV